MEQATFDDFMKLDIRVGTIVEARPFEKARRPAYQLLVDLGPELGQKRSSAQITQQYAPEDLVGKQVLAVVNFPPRQIADFFSQVLVLGTYSQGGVVLITPDKPVETATGWGKIGGIAYGRIRRSDCFGYIIGDFPVLHRRVRRRGGVYHGQLCAGGLFHRLHAQKSGRRTYIPCLDSLLQQVSAGKAGRPAGHGRRVGPSDASVRLPLRLFLRLPGAEYPWFILLLMALLAVFILDTLIAHRIYKSRAGKYGDVLTVFTVLSLGLLRPVFLFAVRNRAAESVPAPECGN